MGAQSSRPPAANAALPPRQPTTSSSQKLPIYSNQRPSQPSRKTAAPTLDESEVEARNLFAACKRRDSHWLDAVTNDAYDEPWQAERSKHRKNGSLEQLAIHRAGSQIIAVVVGSEHSEIGDVLFTVDTRERVQTSFGQPGWGGRLLDKDCVLLVDESADAHVVLYFYVDRVCKLRCWRRHKGVAAGASSGESGRAKPAHHRHRGERRPRHSKEGGNSSHHHRKEARHSSEGRSSSSSSSRSKSSASSAKKQSDEGGEDARVAVWASGKDLASLLGGMSKAFGPQLPHLPSYDMGALRSDPSALRKAYHKALLAVHPDKQNDASPGAQAVAIELFHALSAARAKVAAAEASGVSC